VEYETTIIGRSRTTEKALSKRKAFENRDGY
jgi:hypothetical protein